MTLLAIIARRRRGKSGSVPGSPRWSSGGPLEHAEVPGLYPVGGVPLSKSLQPEREVVGAAEADD